ncbi:MAG: hypothetical protein ACKOFP_09855 [Actinomycetota bacterium]
MIEIGHAQARGELDDLGAQGSERNAHATAILRQRAARDEAILLDLGH